MAKNSIDVDKFIYIAMLYDFYSPLLTKKQRDAIEMYYMQNFSLSEIAMLSGITRQAAGILINRAEKLLAGYEGKLGLAKAHAEDKEKWVSFFCVLNDVINSCKVDDKVKDKLTEAARAVCPWEAAGFFQRPFI